MPRMKSNLLFALTLTPSNSTGLALVSEFLPPALAKFIHEAPIEPNTVLPANTIPTGTAKSRIRVENAVGKNPRFPDLKI